MTAPDGFCVSTRVFPVTLNSYVSSAAYGKGTLGDHRLGGQHVPGDGIRAGIEVERVEDRDLIGVGRLVIRRIRRQWPRALNARKTVVLPGEDVEPRLRIGDRRRIGIGEFGYPPRSDERRAGW